jgi:hypothetical protein
MNKQKTEKVLQFLNAILDPNLSLHSVNFIFDDIATTLRREQLSIKVIIAKHYYLDPELHFVYLKKITAFDDLDVDEAVQYREREIILLQEKGKNENTILRTFPEGSFFEYENKCIVGHLSKEKLNERLVINLIESYTLLYSKKSNRS